MTCIRNWTSVAWGLTGNYGVTTKNNLNPKCIKQALPLSTIVNSNLHDGSYVIDGKRFSPYALANAVSIALSLITPRKPCVDNNNSKDRKKEDELNIRNGLLTLTTYGLMITVTKTGELIITTPRDMAENWAVVVLPEA